MQERRGGKAELIADVRDCCIEEGNSRLVSTGGDEGVKARLDSFEARMAADAFRHVGEGALRLLHCEQPELEEAVARNGRQEVRVAATGVEHGSLGVARRQGGQLILELERAELREFGVIDCAHTKSPKGGRGSIFDVLVRSSYKDLEPTAARRGLRRAAVQLSLSASSRFLGRASPEPRRAMTTASTFRSAAASR